MIPKDTNTNNVNDDNPLPNTSSATDMEGKQQYIHQVSMHIAKASVIPRNYVVTKLVCPDRYISYESYV